MHFKRALMFLAGAAVLLAGAFSTTAHTPRLSGATPGLVDSTELAIVPQGKCPGFELRPSQLFAQCGPYEGSDVKFVLEEVAPDDCPAEPVLEAKTGICIADFSCGGQSATCCASWGRLRKYMTCCGDGGGTDCRRYCDPR